MAIASSFDPAAPLISRAAARAALRLVAVANGHQISLRYENPISLVGEVLRALRLPAIDSPLYSFSVPPERGLFGQLIVHIKPQVLERVLPLINVTEDVVELLEVPIGSDALTRS